ncbi:uncharacterized protein [Eurosta solidaginis]|uniref:uncharacterized protein n=1 Tax=Eurosta solidaginis TaxID=178769 RepID=UPI0035317548
MAPKTASSTKRSRSTAEQIRMMVDLLEEVPGLASGRFQRMHSKLEQHKQWNKLAGKLNAVGGASKSAEQWLTVWRDLKNRTSNRVKDINNQRAQTGNRPISVAPLTDTEKRIVELIGDRYVEGAGICRDSVPMDEEMHLVMEEDEGEVEYL